MEFDKKILFDISSGLYIVGSSLGMKMNAQVANSVIQVSSDPVIVTVCINKNNLTHQYIKESGKFSISVLSDKVSLEFVGWFGFRSGLKINKFDNEQFEFSYLIEGTDDWKIPVVTDYSTSFLLAEVISSHDVGTHTMFFGKVIDAKKISDDPVLSYQDYHVKKNGTTSKNAPTYIK